eukprot:5292143-Ditylum_brightwellii.AAC.1
MEHHQHGQGQKKLKDLLEAQGWDELLSNEDEDAHELKPTNSKHQDGALAWKALKDYYDQYGDKESFGIWREQSNHKWNHRSDRSFSRELKTEAT